MSKREKHDKKPHIVRDELTPAEVAQDVAIGESLAPLDAEVPKFGPAWLGAPRAVPDVLPAVMCTTCGNEVLPGAPCAVDGQIAPRG